MGRKIKVGMILMILGMAFASQYVYAGVLDTTKKENIFGTLKEFQEELPDAPPEETPAELPKIKGYKLQYEMPDGKNGYYHKLPEIRLYHQDEGFVTKYRFCLTDGTVDEGEIDFENKEKVWDANNVDGIYRLELELVKKEAPEPEEPENEESSGKEEGDTEKENTDNIEEVEKVPDDENQDKMDEVKELVDKLAEEPDEKPEEGLAKDLEKWKKSWEWKVDSKGPQIQVLKPAKADMWHRQAVRVEARCSDDFSNVAAFSGGTEEGWHLSNDKENLAFYINEEAVNGKGAVIEIEAEDEAGNKSKVSFEILIDSQMPVLGIAEIEDYVILNKNVPVSFYVFEENCFQSLNASLERESFSGEKEAFSIEKWDGENKRTANAFCEQEGIYKISLEASDAAGNKNMIKKIFTIDKTAPELPNLSNIDGRCMKEFVWNFDAYRKIKDFTTCTSIMEVDGMLYHAGERILREGIHTFSVKAIDAAGNEAEERAVFEIDRTCPVIEIRNLETKEEILSGSRFEKNIQIEIRPGQYKDWIEKVIINGKEQVLTSRKNVSFGLESPKPYEIVVEALDLAGNTVTRRVNIEIIKSKSQVSEIIKPIAKVIKKNDINAANHIESEGGKIKAFCLAVIVISFVLLLMIGYKRKNDGAHTYSKNGRKINSI